uniref:Uncharacterized protein n=1 Tax=Sus scrofa TaxID=9823 RepID=A0A4X1SYA6_PIG
PGKFRTPQLNIKPLHVKAKHTHTNAYIHTHIYTNVYTHTHTHKRVHTHTDAHICVCAYVCIYKCTSLPRPLFKIPIITANYLPVIFNRMSHCKKWK